MSGEGNRGEGTGNIPITPLQGRVAGRRGMDKTVHLLLHHGASGAVGRIVREGLV